MTTGLSLLVTIFTVPLRILVNAVVEGLCLNGQVQEPLERQAPRWLR